MPPTKPSLFSGSLCEDDLTWRPTKIMHIQDLPKDDDFLSHLLVEKLGTGAVPLLVHKMDPSRRLPKTHSSDLTRIVRRYVTSKLPMEKAIKQAVDELLALPPIRYYLKTYTQKQVNAFATHASRYFELYHPSGSIEIAHTSRYSHRTGKSELCILATRNIPAHTVVAELKGSMANLTDEEDEELKRTDLRNCVIRRDFSVIHSKSMKKNHLFLGPARFVNHDCNNNCELFREGRYITFRTLRAIAVGEELTAHYGDGYFGKKNKHCLCETCEKNGKGGYAPNRDEDGPETTSSDGASDSDSDDSSSPNTTENDGQPVMNLDERRTRRGVYAVSKPALESSDESVDDEDDNIKPLANASDVPADGEIELTADFGPGSNPSSRAPSLRGSDSVRPTTRAASLTPAVGSSNPGSSSASTKPTSTGPAAAMSNQSTSFRSIISTRSQKAKVCSSTDNSNVPTPVKPASRSGSMDSPRRLTRSVSMLRVSEKAKGKAQASSPTPSSITSPVKSSKSSGKDESKAKTDENDVRFVGKDAPKIREVPRGPDGKPLPTCVTCSNVLPLISVDSKVIWGLETGKKDKNAKLDCPRCMRHFAIYEVPWPRRVLPPGAMSATPREESAAPAETNTKNVTTENLSVIDRRIAAVVSSSSLSNSNKKSKKRPHDPEPEPERKQKKRKPEPEPAAVVHKAKVIITYASAHRRTMNLPQRPVLRLPPASVKVEEAEKDASQPQPRSNNGRFARKTRSSGPLLDNGEGIAKASPRKRTTEEVDGLEESPRKRSAHEPERREEAVQKLIPRRASGLFAGRLFSKPNPQRFALRAWAAPGVVGDSPVSSEDDTRPVTPEDDISPAADTVVESDEDDGIRSSRVMVSRTPMLTRAPLSCIHPSPLAFAKSRWSSFGQGTLSRRTRSFEELYGSETELTETPRSVRDTVYSPHPSGDYPSDDDTIRRPLRQSYPILSPSAALKPFRPKGTRFFSTNSETKPTLVNAGWDDALDATEL